MAGPGQYREKRPSSPHVGHDRSTPSERVVRSSLALLRRLQHPGVDGDRLPKRAPAVRQDSGSLTKVHLPDGLANELQLWKLECKKASSKKASPDAFIFPNANGGFMDTDNYRFRVLKPPAEELGIPKLNFQILRRTMATQAQSMGSVKDIQAHLRHSRPDTTAHEYMQALPESVRAMVGSVYQMLMKGGEGNVF